MPDLTVTRYLNIIKPYILYVNVNMMESIIQIILKIMEYIFFIVDTKNKKL